MTLVDHLFAVIPMLGLLIFVHELGHFLAAKLFGVRVLKFSLGFGPPVGFGRFRMRWVRGGTEYVVAWFPLGGFVKMLGEQLHGDDAADAPVVDAAPDEYHNAKPVWQKLSITFAGPFMNLALPVVAFVFVLMVGLPRPSAIIGTVERGSPAALAGLQSGDQILSIDGEAAQWWDEDVKTVVRGHTEGVLEMRVERSDRVLDFQVPVSSRSGLDEFGAIEKIGWIGLGSRRLPSLLGVPSGDAAAARAGLRSGDRVTQVDGVPVEDWESLRRAYESASGAQVSLEIERGEEPEKVVVAVPALGTLDALGLVPASILVASVAPDMPAAAAGIEAGDLILAVDGQPVGSFASFAEIVRSSGGRALEISYARDGTSLTATLVPVESDVPGPLGIEGMEERVYLIGITHALASLDGVTAIDRERNPLIAIPRAVAMTVDMTVLFLRGLSKFFTGEVGTDKLAGPIGIAEIARKSLDLGWQAYLYTMILISINLGILNLLPIPILDGGQALIFAVEGIKRAPISLRTREVVQSVGLTMLMLLMALAFWNDLSRHFSTFVEWLRGTGL